MRRSRRVMSKKLSKNYQEKKSLRRKSSRRYTKKTGRKMKSRKMKSRKMNRKVLRTKPLRRRNTRRRKNRSIKQQILGGSPPLFPSENEESPMSETGPPIDKTRLRLIIARKRSSLEYKIKFFNKITNRYETTDSYGGRGGRLKSGFARALYLDDAGTQMRAWSSLEETYSHEDGWTPWRRADLTQPVYLVIGGKENALKFEHIIPSHLQANTRTIFIKIGKSDCEVSCYPFFMKLEEFDANFPLVLDDKRNRIDLIIEKDSSQTYDALQGKTHKELQTILFPLLTDYDAEDSLKLQAAGITPGEDAAQQCASIRPQTFTL